jgi:hypothetical protein
MAKGHGNDGLDGVAISKASLRNPDFSILLYQFLVELLAQENVTVSVA